MFKKLKDSVESAEIETTLYLENDKDDPSMEITPQQSHKNTIWDVGQDSKDKKKANKK